MGSLSRARATPRSRFIQSGDVEYLVAMTRSEGPQFDVDSRRFSRRSQVPTAYTVPPSQSGRELAQIAGRDGRASRDGTSAPTGRCQPFETELARLWKAFVRAGSRCCRGEHRTRFLFARPPCRPRLPRLRRGAWLTRARSRGHPGLEIGARRRFLRNMAGPRQRHAEVWGVCQVTDLSQDSPAAHAELVICRSSWILMRGGKRRSTGLRVRSSLPTTSKATIDTLSNRIANYPHLDHSRKPARRLAIPTTGRAVARAVADKLDEAMHERLTNVSR